jgi:hypothetical protein
MKESLAPLAGGWYSANVRLATGQINQELGRCAVPKNRSCARPIPFSLSQGATTTKPHHKSRKPLRTRAGLRSNGKAVMTFEFGKFRGLKITDPQIPTAYLEWLGDKMTTDAADIAAELERRELAEAAERTLTQRLVIAGYRALAKEYKNDAAVLRELDGARAALQGVLEQYFDEPLSNSKGGGR